MDFDSFIKFLAFVAVTSLILRALADIDHIVAFIIKHFKRGTYGHGYTDYL